MYGFACKTIGQDDRRKKHENCELVIVLRVQLELPDETISRLVVRKRKDVQKRPKRTAVGSLAADQYVKSTRIRLPPANATCKT
jgi:hypothetical protein